MARNRTARRALARTLTRAFGRGVTPADNTTERLDKLEAENRRLRAELNALNTKQDQIPGVVEDRKDWFVLVGGQRVNLKAIPPVEWIRTMEELPSFLWSYAINRSTRAQVEDDALEKILDLAKRWITASAVSLDGINLEHLTLPEAEHAVSHISDLNGVTAQLRAWFRDRLGLAGTAPHSPDVRASAESTARRLN